ncbi:hypothetical protein ACFS4T_04675 [Pseudomonas lini]
MTASGAGGDVAGVEDVQVEAQVGQVEVHGDSLRRFVGWADVFAGKPRSYRIHVVLEITDPL